MAITVKDLEIILDTREQSDETIATVQKFFPKIVRRKLDLGDIAYKNLAFELKTFGDFIATIKDKRFRAQLYNLLINKDIEAYYIIHGEWIEINKYSNININAFLGAIASIEARYGVHVLIFPNIEYAIYTISKIIEKSFDHKEVRPTTFKLLTNERAIGMICASAEKVGIKDAKRLLNKYGTIQHIVNLGKDDLESVHKIGEKKAKRMIETFRYDFSAKKRFDDEFDIDFDIKNDKIEKDDIPLQIDVDNEIEATNIDKPKSEILESMIMDEADIIDIETDKISNDILESVPPKEQIEKDIKITNDNKVIFYGEPKSIEDYDKKKYIVYKAVKLYIQKKRRSCPLSNIIAGVKICNEKEIKQLLYDLELESKIYQSKIGYYDVF